MELIIARFGNSINEIMDRETISGTSVLKQYNSALAMIRRYYQYEEISEIERKKGRSDPGKCLPGGSSKRFDSQGLEHEFSYSYIVIS